MKEQHDKDRLKSLFEQISLDEPSSGFEDVLMKKILHEAEKKNAKRSLYNSIYTAIAIASGIAAIILLPVLIFYFSDIEIPELIVKFPQMNFSNGFSRLHFNPLIVSISLVVLALLMVDTLMRKNITNKKNKS